MGKPEALYLIGYVSYNGTIWHFGSRHNRSAGSKRAIEPPPGSRSLSRKPQSNEDRVGGVGIQTARYLSTTLEAASNAAQSAAKTTLPESSSITRDVH